MIKSKSLICVLLIMALLCAVFAACADEAVTVSFDDGTNVTEVAVENSAIKMPPEPTRTGYIFSGWFYDKDEYLRPAQESDLAKQTQSVTVYAKWEQSSVVKLIFNSNGGSPVATYEKIAGESIEAPVEPTRDNYVFGGWFKDEKFTVLFEFTVMPKEHTTLYAKWTAAEYKYVFYQDDGITIISEGKLAHGSAIPMPPNPTKASTAEFTYDFLAWSPDVPDNITADQTFVATYTETPREYTYVFKDYDGSVVFQETAVYGSAVTVPQAPAREETVSTVYEFIGWDPEVSSTLTQDVVYTAIYGETPRIYKYIFRNEDGSIIAEGSAAYGKPIPTPPNPTKPADTDGENVFEGWSPEVPEFIAGDSEFTATFKKILYEYEYAFYNGGDVIEQGTLKHGSVIPMPANPVKPADAQYTYIFTGWSPSVPDVITDDMVFTAQYNEILNEYTYTFINHDGTTISSVTADYGSVLTPPEPPVKPSTDTKEYIFTGWLPALPDILTENAEYTAQFEEQDRYYTVTFQSNGGTDCEPVNVRYDGIVSAPKCVREGYILKGWLTSDGAIFSFNTPIKSDLTLTADWRIMSFRITFDSDGGTPTDAQSVNYGQKAVEPKAPEKVGSVFLYWRTESGERYNFDLEIKTDLELTAVYDVARFSVTYDAGVEYNIPDEIVDYNGDAPVPTEPERTGYVIVGWYKDSGYVTIWDFDADAVIEDTVLYGKWEQGTQGLTYALSDTGGYIVTGKKQGVNLGNSLIVPSAYLGKHITGIGNEAFSSVSVRNITMPDSITVIGKGAFKSNGSVGQLYLPANLVSIGDEAFNRCTNLSKTLIPKSVRTIGKNAFAHCSRLSEVTFESASELTELGAGCFYFNKVLTVINVPDGVTVIEENTFAGCSKLKTVTHSDNVTEIGDNAMEGCAELQNYVLPSALTSLGNKSFYNAVLLRSAVIPIGVERIGNEAFSGCVRLESVDFGAVKIIGDNAFFNCDSLTELALPETLTAIQSGAFLGLTGLQTLELPVNLNSVGMNAFADCTGLTSVTMGDNITEILAGAFKNCTGLQNVALSDNLTRINESAFENCSTLLAITIPSSVVYVGQNAFYKCSTLTITLAPGIDTARWNNDWNPDNRPVV